MFEDRNVKLDVTALALLALVVFLGLALFSYTPADAITPGASSSLVYPSSTEPANICGRAGAWLSDGLLRMLGVGAYYLVISLAVLDVLCLMRKPIEHHTLRAFGWVISLVGIATFAAMALPQLAPSLWAGPELGPGGYLGATGRGLLEMHFASVGAYILVVCLIAGGLLLSTDYFLVQLGVWCVATPAKAALGRAARRREAEDEYEEDEYEEEDEEEDEEVAIRIRGKVVTNDEDEVEEEDEEIEDELEEEEEDDDSEDVLAEDEEEEEKKPSKSSVRSRLATALRIKKPPTKTERDAVMEELNAADDDKDLSDYELPDIDLLLQADDFHFEAQEKEVRQKAKMIEKTFLSFGFNVKVVEIETGPVIAQYEVELEAGLRLSKITGLADDLAIALRVPTVRIVAPIPGKNSVGIEVPNTERQVVRLREVMEESLASSRKMKLPIFAGKDVSGKPLVCDLATLPHLLIAGRTGTGKSVCLNTIISSIVMTRRPDEVKMLMIDPKMVELSPYKKLPHLMHPVVTDMRKAEAILAWAVDKMEERYSLLARAGVRHISVYNQLGEQELIDRIEPETEEEQQGIPSHLPYIVIVADEIADLMMTAGKEVETHIIRLAQKSRAVGIHLVLATQKPTVDVITGLIKSNLPARICFQVASRTDSRVVLDEMGADKLLGNGDMLFLWPGTSTLVRGQGTFLSDDEITKVIESVATDTPQYAKELVQLKAAGAEDGDKEKFKNRDELYEDAIDTIVREGRGSVSLLQRALGVGYGRGARLIDFMAEDGIVGPYNGSQAREVLLSPEQWAEMQGEDIADVAPPSPSRRNRIQLAPPEEFEEDDAEFADPNAELEEEEVAEVEDADDEAEDEDEEVDESDESDDEDEEEEDEEEAELDEEEDELEEEEDEYEEDEGEEDEAEPEEEDRDLAESA